MKEFAELYNKMDQTDKIYEKETALVEYFQMACDKDKVWAIALLSQNKPKRTIASSKLKEWSLELSKLPLWLFEESYNIVGDIAETVAHILPPPAQQSDKSLNYWISYITELKNQELVGKKRAVLHAWDSLNVDERYIFNKLITGGLRADVTHKTIVKALSKTTGLEENRLTYRLMCDWNPVTISYEELVLTIDPIEQFSKPYPFHIAESYDENANELGKPDDWIAERKWDGLRGQLIIRQGHHFLWSKDENLLTNKVPEITDLASKIKRDIVIDGEILPFKDGKPLSVNLLQSRLARKTVTKKDLAEVPIHIIAYDLLEFNSEDIRNQSLVERRKQLEEVVSEINDERMLLSNIIAFDTWEQLANERDDSRNHSTSGIILKKKESTYLSHNKNWLTWKVDPMTVDAILLYAQRGRGKRGGHYTDFTFAVWDGTSLVPFTKAYSGLSDKEYKEITNWIKSNTKERFGPVASVKPELVFQLVFGDIARSARHKSGIVLRSPKIKKWKRDMLASDVGTLYNLKKLIRN